MGGPAAAISRCGECSVPSARPLQYGPAYSVIAVASGPIVRDGDHRDSVMAARLSRALVIDRASRNNVAAAARRARDQADGGRMRDPMIRPAAADRTRAGPSAPQQRDVVTRHRPAQAKPAVVVDQPDQRPDLSRSPSAASRRRRRRVYPPQDRRSPISCQLIPESFRAGFFAVGRRYREHAATAANVRDRKHQPCTRTFGQFGYHQRARRCPRFVRSAVHAGQTALLGEEPTRDQPPAGAVAAWRQWRSRRRHRSSGE